MPLAKQTYILQKLMYPLLGGLFALIGAHFFILNLGYEISWEKAITDALVTNFILAIVIASIVQFLTFYQPKRNSFFYAGLITSIESVFAGFILVYILRCIHPDPDYVQFVRETTLMRIILCFLICISMVKGILLFNQLEEFAEISSIEIKNKEFLREAELNKLQQQLQPHFLFNSLNSINALILSNPEEASRMVQKLSDFLRYTTKNTNEQFVSLKEEIKFLELYLDIEKVRFGYRLTIDKNISANCLPMVIPALVLQPIVENAIKFGLYGTTDAIIITVSVTCNEKMIEITVTNPFDKDMQPLKGTGFGVNGLKRRLYLLYARNDLIETQSENNKFIAKIKIPVKK